MLTINEYATKCYIKNIILCLFVIKHSKFVQPEHDIDSQNNKHNKNKIYIYNIFLFFLNNNK